VPFPLTQSWLELLKNASDQSVALHEADRTQFVIVFMVWAAGLGAAAQFGKVAVVLSEFRATHDVSEVALGFLVSCVGLAGLIFGVLGGILLPRIGIRRAFVLGMMSAAVLSALQAFSLPFIGIIVLRILEGVSHLAIVVAGPILMARHSSERLRGAVMTLWSSFFGLSYMFIALLAPMLLALGGISAMFLSHSAYMLGIGLVLWGILPNATSAQASVVKTEKLNVSEILRLHVMIYRSPWLSAAALGFVFYTALYIALLTYLPEFVSVIYRSGMSATLPLASIVTSLTLGVVLLRFVAPVTAVMIGFLLTGVAALSLPFAGSNDPLFIVFCIVLLAATGLIPGASFAALAQLNTDEDARAFATGAIAQLGNVGTTCGPPILAAIISLSGVNGAVGFVVLFCFCGILIHLWLGHRRALSLAAKD